MYKLPLALLIGLVVFSSVLEAARKPIAAVHPNQTLNVNPHFRTGDKNLCVGIHFFKPTNSQSLAAETQFAASRLRSTLEDSQQWGAVQIAPASGRRVFDVWVECRILRSTGRTLDVYATVKDATENVWLSVQYFLDLTTAGDGPSKTPYQPLWNRLANDMANYRQTKVPMHTIGKIKRTKNLRYAAGMSSAFNKHLQVQGNKVFPISEPAADNPQWELAQSNRQIENDYFDQVSQVYLDGENQLAKSYSEYLNQKRISALNIAQAEAQRQQHVAQAQQKKKQADNQKFWGSVVQVGGELLDIKPAERDVVRQVGGHMSKTGAELERQADQHDRVAKQAAQKATIHATTMQKQSQAFDRAVQTAVVSIQGREVALTGSLEAQHAKLKKVLAEIQQLENGTHPSQQNSGTLR